MVLANINDIIFNEHKMKKKLLLAFICSILIFLITCWSALLKQYAAGFTESICYFVFTYFTLKYFSESNNSGKTTVLVTVIITGRIILEIPIRAMNFYGSLGSLGITISVIVSIILSSLCHKEKNASVFVLSTIIIVLLNTLGLYIWDELFPTE